MASAYTPPFFSSRQNQANWYQGVPNFGIVTVGDASLVDTGVGQIRVVKYSGGVYNAWELASPVPTEMRLTQYVGAGSSTIADFTSALTTYYTPLQATAFQGPSIVVTDGTATETTTVTHINTAVVGPTTILTLPIPLNTTAVVKVAITYSRSTSITGSITFEYRTRNAAAIVVNSLMQNVQRSFDAGLAGTDAGLALSGSNSLVTVTGLAGVSINWGASAKVLTMPS